MGTNPQPAWQPLAIEGGAPLPKRPTASEAREVQGNDPVNRIDAITARLEEARERSVETLRDLPESRLLTRAEADRQRLVRDGKALLEFAREVEKLAQDGPHTGPFTAHGYTARLRALLAGLNEGDAS